MNDSLQERVICKPTKNQATFALFTTEMEYVNLTAATQEGLWLMRLEREVNTKAISGMKIYFDSQRAISSSLVNNYHPRTKHIDVKFQFIRSLIEENRLSHNPCVPRKWYRN